MPRVEKVLVWAGLQVPDGGRLPPDRLIVTSCPTCAETQTLADADFVEDDAESVYTCRRGCQPILIVGAPEPVAWPGRGYRMGDFVVRNAADVDISILDEHGAPLETSIRLPVSPAALDERLA